MAIPRRRTLLVEMALEQAQANYVRQVLGESANAIEEKLAKIGTSGNPLTRMQLEAQRSSIKAMLNQDFKNIQESIANGKTEAAKAASGVVSQYENQLLKVVMDPAAMRRIARSEAQRAMNNLEAAIKRMQGTSYNTLSKQVYKTKQLADGWVDDIVDKALVSGWSARQLADAVIPSISPNVRGGVSYAANRLARTEINNAYHAASWDRYNRSAIVEEVEWLLSSSHPEDDICNDYAAQSPFKKNGVPAKPHPNCYCYIVPRLPTEEEFLERLFAGEYGDEPFMREAIYNPSEKKPLIDPVSQTKGDISSSRVGFDYSANPDRAESAVYSKFRGLHNRGQSYDTTGKVVAKPEETRTFQSHLKAEGLWEQRSGPKLPDPVGFLDAEGRLVLLDGHHRVARSWLSGTAPRVSVLDVSKLKWDPDYYDKDEWDAIRALFKIAK